MITLTQNVNIWNFLSWEKSECTLLFWNTKVFFEDFYQEVNFNCSQIFYYHYLFNTPFYNLISTLYACFLTTCSCLYCTSCPYFSEQAGHNTEACCRVLVLSFSLKRFSFRGAICLWLNSLGWHLTADPVDSSLTLWCILLSEPRYYKFTLVSSIFNSFKEKNLACFLRHGISFEVIPNIF